MTAPNGSPLPIFAATVRSQGHDPAIPCDPAVCKVCAPVEPTKPKRRRRT